jgi:hypothetical protein
MPISFPTSPTNGQTYTVGSKIWQWNATNNTWDAVPNPYSPTGAQGTTGTQGITGFQGITGAQGPTGTQGITGTQGTQATQGITGAQGITGTAGLNTFAFNNNIFVSGSVALSNASTTILAYSTDAVTWTTVAAPISGGGPLTGVAYGKGTWIATFGSSRIFTTYCGYSTDGITWTTSLLPSSNGWAGVALWKWKICSYS